LSFILCPFNSLKNIQTTHLDYPDISAKISPGHGFSTHRDFGACKQFYHHRESKNTAARLGHRMSPPYPGCVLASAIPPLGCRQAKACGDNRTRSSQATGSLAELAAILSSSICLGGCWYETSLRVASRMEVRRVRAGVRVRVRYRPVLVSFFDARSSTSPVG
jgi:hypothetical protein